MIANGHECWPSQVAFFWLRLEDEPKAGVHFRLLDAIDDSCDAGTSTDPIEHFRNAINLDVRRRNPLQPTPQQQGTFFALSVEGSFSGSQSEWPDPSMTKDNLIRAIEAEAIKLPGNKVGFSQPIEMRFNELIAGVQEDLGIKVFGDDFSVMQRTASRIADVLRRLTVPRA